MPKKIKIGQKIPITITRRESNFDRACDEAYKHALIKFGIDEDGHSKIADFERSSDSIVVEFIRYQLSGGMGGLQHLYAFKAWIDRYSDE